MGDANAEFFEDVVRRMLARGHSAGDLHVAQVLTGLHGVDLEALRRVQRNPEVWADCDELGVEHGANGERVEYSLRSKLIKLGLVECPLASVGKPLRHCVTELGCDVLEHIDRETKKNPAV